MVVLMRNVLKIKYLVPSWWRSLGMLRRGGLAGGSMSLVPGFESSQSPSGSRLLSAVCLQLRP